MRSFPILSIGAALGASMMRMRPLGFGRARVRSSKYQPHQGAKERERARRCYMVGGIMHQMSKRQYEAYFREVA
jgi:hypothetical protein